MIVQWQILSCSYVGCTGNWKKIVFIFHVKFWNTKFKSGSDYILTILALEYGPILNYQNYDCIYTWIQYMFKCDIRI